MDYGTRWKIMEQLGAGGQGEVFRVLDLEKIDYDRLFRTFKRGITPSKSKSDQLPEFEALRQAIIGMVRMEEPLYSGALKQLYRLRDKSRNDERALERITREIVAMKQIQHNNILRLIDADPDSRWFVSEYHPAGTLATSGQYTGDFVGALKAMRPLVEGVAEIHKQGYVHRDIKPLNVFLSSTGQLVLGDFGLVYYEDETKTRLSATLENVGSRDWMPGWAFGIRVEDVRPSFDVFSLGKLLWSMIYPNKVLRLWYFDQEPFNLSIMFPRSPYIHLASEIFRECIVEHEKDCLPNASTLLCFIDEILTRIDCGGDYLERGVIPVCRICGRGKYVEVPSSTLGVDSRRRWDILACKECGNMLFFSRQIFSSLGVTQEDKRQDLQHTRRNIDFQSLLRFLKELYEVHHFSAIHFTPSSGTESLFTSEQLTHAAPGWDLSDERGFLAAWIRHQNSVRRVRFSYSQKKGAGKISMTIDLDEGIVSLDETPSIAKFAVATILNKIEVFFPKISGARQPSNP